ncbi:MAG: hypothetical protein ACRD5L_11075, partial [Bryobacteraceae bacterium]
MLRGLSEVHALARAASVPALIGLAFCAGVAHAAIFPDQIGDFTKGASQAVALADRPLYDEYGVQAVEQAQY